ncbi:hypothetical protein [Lysinibacillus telephonicus]|nr:hypothetical protein [Lysinibacillus telephonicus]
MKYNFNVIISQLNEDKSLVMSNFKCTGTIQNLKLQNQFPLMLIDYAES